VIDDACTIGRFRNHAIMVRSIALPLGEPPA
jgi:hypothetical protein